MAQILTGGFLAFLLSFFIMPFVIKLARDKKLYDLPDERKTHLSPIPSLGGIGIFVGFIISLLLVNNFIGSVPEMQYYIAAFFILFILGILDDIFILSAPKKVIGQIIVATILVMKGHLMITNLHGFLGIGELNTAVSYFITFFVLLLIINSFNLIDGVDGLAGSIGLITLTIFATFLFINNDIPDALVAFTLAGSLMAFLIYNFHPAKIFMGDSGSMLIGLVTAVIVLRFLTNANIFAANASSNFTMAFGILLLPLMDVLRVFCLRIFKWRSPFAPDRNHLHHLLLNKGFSHKQVTFILVSLSVLFGTLAFIFQSYNINLVLFSLAAFFFAAVAALKFTPTKYKWLHVVTDKDIIKANKKVKVVSIYSTEKVAAGEED
jgi:UDP-N-acetylmuramyl pentapeptide phosphotransferase/UDP-N-acetylglucosamine-1-phosphate transferase